MLYLECTFVRAVPLFSSYIIKGFAHNDDEGAKQILFRFTSVHWTRVCEIGASCIRYMSVVDYESTFLLTSQGFTSQMGIYSLLSYISRRLSLSNKNLFNKNYKQKFYFIFLFKFYFIY